MKKLFTFCLSLVFGGLAFTAQAQVDDVFQFCYEDGTIVPDGSTVTVNTVETDFFGDPFINSGLFVKNTSSENVFYTLHYSIKECPAESGGFQICSGGNCKPATTVLGDYEFEGATGIRAGNMDNMMCEWFTKNVTGKCVVECQVYNRGGSRTSDGQGGYTYPQNVAGSKITVVFTTESTGIDGVEAAGSNEEVARYTLDGRKLSAPQKGVNIVKYADGSTKKVVVE